MKKLLLLFLACVLTLCPMSFASASSATIYTSDFEGEEAVSISSSGSITYSDSVWDINHSIWGASGYATFVTTEYLDVSKIADTANADNMVLKAIAKKPNTTVKTKSIALNESMDTVYTVFNFRVPAGTNSGFWQLTGGNDGTKTYAGANMPLLVIKSDGNFAINDQDAQYSQFASTTYGNVAYTTGVWYTAVIKVSTTGRQAFIYDTTGTCLIESEISAASESSPLTYGYAELKYYMTGSAAISMPIEIDNTKMILTGAAATPSLVTSGIANDDAASRKLNVEMTSNMLLDTASVTVSLKKGVTPLVKGVDYTVIFPDPFTVKVASTALLDRKAEYTLEVSAGSTTYAPITFTTEENHLLTPGELTLDTLDADGNVAESDISTLAAGKVKVTLPATDPLGYPSFSGRMMAALYTETGHLSWFDFAELSGADFSALSAVFTLPEIPANASLKVFLFDGVNAFMPVCAPVTFGS